MKESYPAVGSKVILCCQICLLLGFYVFVSGVFTFLWYAVYRAFAEHDSPIAHSVILASVITFAFVILTSVVTMVFTTIIREGQRKIMGNGGQANGSKI